MNREHILRFIGLGVVKYQITQDLSTNNCGVKGLERLQFEPNSKEIPLEKMYEEFYSYIVERKSHYKIQEESDEFWNKYSNIPTRAIFILSGAVNNDGTPWPKLFAKTIEFCHHMKLPHFDFMVNPFHTERKSAVYAICVPYEKRRFTLLKEKV